VENDVHAAQRLPNVGLARDIAGYLFNGKPFQRPGILTNRDADLPASLKSARTRLAPMWPDAPVTNVIMTILFTNALCPTIFF
jgi:hypothetical protein